MKNNNLQSLNEILFDTLRGVKDGSIKTETAKSINMLSSTIINNAKVQLEAISITNGGRGSEHFGVKGISASKEPEGTFEKKLEFAKSLGYKNVAEAIKDLTAWEFEKNFKESITD